MPTFITNIWIFCQEIGHYIYEAAYEHVLFACRDDYAHPTLTSVIILALIILLLSFSAAYSASIAMCRRHPHLYKFILLGFFLPIGYPIYILLNLPVYGDAELKKQLAAEKVIRDREKAQKKQEERQKLIQENPDAPINLRWNADVMNKICKKPDGTDAGPWTLTFAGEELQVNRIIEVQEDFVQVEISGSRDGANVNMRIPYAKIEDWK